MLELIRPAVDLIRERANASDTRLLVALDGGSGAGKSTLGRMIAAATGGALVHGDDFFRATVPKERWPTTTPAQRSRCVMDWDRARREALAPLLAGRTARWRPFDTESPDRLSARTVVREAAAVIVFDCIYSTGPDLADLVEVAILVDAEVTTRRRRHNEREGTTDADWHAVWDSAEDYFFTQVRPRDSFDLVITTDRLPLA